MMTFQWLSISIIFIVLSLVQIDALGYPRVRQATNGNCTFPDNFCQFVECINGQCLEDKTTSDCYKCQCTVGFTGKLCDTPIVTRFLATGCGSGCQNGGRCEQTAANTSICICPPNFTGSQCETATVANHICVTNPASVCQNGGTCTTNGADYLCNCPAEWTGVNCQTKNQITSCNQNPCGAHGTCIEAMLPSGSVVFCNCENQWTGKYCDVNQAVNCSNGFCQSGGTCQMNGNIPVCNCPPTHAGQQCETLISTMTTTTATFTTTSFSAISPVPGSCSSSPCLNGASCFNTGNSFICLCTPQWTGLTCNVQNSITTPVPTTASGVNPCTSNPCNNGGSCLKHSTGFICVCTSQYTGPTCALVRTTTATVPTSSSITCANQPCQNGAACYNAGSSYFCYCGTNSNFTGKNCETSISLTSPPAQQSDCPLNCAPGHCVRSGGNQYAYACMCNGILTPTRCSP